VSHWYNDKVQFARLLDEIAANIAFSDKDCRSLEASMNLPRKDIWNIFERAQDYFTKVKEDLVQKKA